MLADLKPIFGKVLVILIIVLVYYLITKYNNENRNEIKTRASVKHKWCNEKYGAREVWCTRTICY